MNNIARESLLYDFYGELLTDKKRSVMECYHEDDMSLAEIADDMGISRAAVYDSLKSAETQLEQYEEKLGLLARYEEASMLAEEADAIIDGLESRISGKCCTDSETYGKDIKDQSGDCSKETGNSKAEIGRLREIIAALASND